MPYIVERFRQDIIFIFFNKIKNILPILLFYEIKLILTTHAKLGAIINCYIIYIINKWLLKCI